MGVEININGDVNNSNITEGDQTNITINNYNTSNDGEEPDWEYEINVGHNIDGVPSLSHEEVRGLFSRLLTDRGIESFDALEGKGTYKGEEEDSTTIKIKRKHEDGDIRGVLVDVARKARVILKQETISFAQKSLDGGFKLIGIDD